MTSENAQVLISLEALIEKLNHGTVDVSFDISRGVIKASTFTGRKRLIYKKDNKQAISDIGERLLKGIQQKKSEQIAFVVTLRDGYVSQTIWHTTMKHPVPESQTIDS